MKMISRLFSVLVGVIGMTAILSHTALAQDVPGSCQAPARAQTQYLTGEKFGKLVVDQAWNTINQDCGLVESFISNVESVFNRLILPPNATQAVQCRHAGIINGGIDALDDLWTVCESLCTSDGDAVGKLIGKLYCDLSISIRGLDLADDFTRGDVTYCQGLGEIFCDASYMSFTLTYETPSGSCLPYTDDPYTDVWDQYRNNGCAENPTLLLPVQEEEEKVKNQ
jgi:hypothetical protein